MDKLPKIVPPGTKGKTPCGLYRTNEALGDRVPANLLVYYHNHGDPGPGIYPVERWQNNKAQFRREGITVTEEEYVKSMTHLKDEGFYRVAKEFYCCEKKCRKFERDTLIQLGYNGDGAPIVFVPEWHPEGLLLPEKGNLVDDDVLGHIKPLKVVFKFASGDHGEAS